MRRTHNPALLQLLLCTAALSWHGAHHVRWHVAQGPRLHTARHLVPGAIGRQSCPRLSVADAPRPVLEPFSAGVKRDIRRKLPFYASDLRDGISVKALASTLFLFFACLAPAVRPRLTPHLARAALAPSP